MKKFILSFTVFAIASFATVSFKGNTQKNRISKKERFGIELKLCQEAFAKGKPSKCKLYGKIKFVKSFPDVKVKIVTSFPDIKVKKVTSFANKPGLWKIVKSFPDYKVKIVDSFPDYKIKYVTSFPGCK